MKRDMELMRKILVAIEEQYSPGKGVIFDLKVEGYSLADIAEHCDLLFQAGLVQDYKPLSGDDTIVAFGIGNLTNRGYDYLDIIRSKDVWDKTKEQVKKNNLPETIEWIGKVAGAIIGEMGGNFIKSLARQ